MKSQVILDNKGVTLVELLISIAIFVMLAALTVGFASNLLVTSQLTDATDQSVQTLRLAHSRAMARRSNIDHGVYFLTNGMVLFQGESYSTRDPNYDRTISFDSSIEINTSSLASELLFSKNVGEPSVTGTLFISHSVQGTNAISINNLGIISQN